jgi:cytochrome c oxidase subunit 3
MFLAALMAVVLWWLLRQTVNVRPWETQLAVHELNGAALARPPAKVALVVFLAVATSLFALFISAYAMRLDYLDWSPVPQPRLLMWNTAVLVAASVAMEWAVYAARRADRDGVRKGLLAAGLLTAGFIVGQLVVWKQFNDAGYFLSTSAATAFFYLLTAVHGLHVVGGLVAWVRTARRAQRGDDPARIRLGVELCAIYWHFLLAVWVVLFTILVSNTLGLAICAPGTSL